VVVGLIGASVAASLAFPNRTPHGTLAETGDADPPPAA
jgi:hypothetical protein